MSNDPSDGFYNLDDARRISESLQKSALGPPRLETAAEPVQETSYIRFKFARPRVTAPPAPPASPIELLELPEPIPDAIGSLGWARMLAWSVKALNAHGAFVIDAQGLVLALHGELEKNEMEAMGARLLIAFDQADQMVAKTRATSITIEIGSAFLTGMRLLVGPFYLTLGLQTRAPLSAVSRAHLIDAFTRKASAGGWADES